MLCCLDQQLSALVSVFLHVGGETLESSNGSPPRGPLTSLTRRLTAPLPQEMSSNQRAGSAGHLSGGTAKDAESYRPVKSVETDTTVLFFRPEAAR